MRSSRNPFLPQAILPTCDATLLPVQSQRPCDGEGASFMRSCQEISQSSMRSSQSPLWPQATLPSCDATLLSVQSRGPCDGQGADLREAASRHCRAARPPHGPYSGYRQFCHQGHPGQQHLTTFKEGPYYSLIHPMSVECYRALALSTLS